MNTYVGKVSLFNGLYPKEFPVRVAASSFEAAARLAVKSAIAEMKRSQCLKRIHIEAIRVVIDRSVS